MLPVLMAEQLLLTGTINESYLRVMDTAQARVDIGVTLFAIQVYVHKLRDELLHCLESYTVYM